MRHRLLRRKVLRMALGIAWAALLPASAGQAVLIDSGDGTGNTSAPPDDPGWDHVGRRGGLTAVYLGDGWLLTANHVAFGPVEIDGTSYSMISSTSVRLKNEDGSLADLKVVGLAGVPPLPLLPIRSTPPSVGTAVVMAGNGHDRGAALAPCDPDPTMDPPPSLGGYQWLASKALRWGTNEVSGSVKFDDKGNRTRTELFLTSFDEAATLHEAQATTGDSGGPVFIKNGSQWELAGIMLAVQSYPVCQSAPLETTMYTNRTYSADLSYYRDQIQDIVALPEPDGAMGLVCAGIFLAVLGRRRGRA